MQTYKNDIKISKISKLYRSETYVDKYFWSIFFFVCITIIELFSLAYIFVKSRANEIKLNWASERCKLQTIPFAGMIMQPNDMTAFEFTQKNFIDCQQTIIQNIFEYLTKPLGLSITSLADAYNWIIKQIQLLRQLLAKIRELATKLIENAINAIHSILVPFQHLIIVFEDTFNKINAILSATLYFIMSIMLGIQTMYKVMLNAIVTIFTIIATVIIYLFVTPIFIPIGAVLLSQFLILSGHFKVIGKFFRSVMGISPSKSMPKDPKKPGKINFKVCFHPDTLVNSKTKIKDIKVGDMLSDGSIVKAVFILLCNKDEQFYKPIVSNSNCLLVTSSHKVMLKNKWVCVKDHPEFCQMTNPINTQLVYCLNTSTKRIYLDGYCFLDWDEVESTQVANSWYKHYKEPSQNLEDLFDNRLIGIVDLGNGHWHSINPFLTNDYDSYTETYMAHQQ